MGIALCPECKIEPPVSGLSPKTAGGRDPSMDAGTVRVRQRPANCGRSMIETSRQ